MKSAATTSRPETLRVDLPAAGTYRLNVLAASGGSAYTLTASTGGTAPPPPPPPGDPVYTGTVDNNGATADPKSKVWLYKADGPTSLDLSLDWADPSANLNIIVKNPAGMLLRQSLSKTAKPESLHVDLPAAGHVQAQRAGRDRRQRLHADHHERRGQRGQGARARGQPRWARPPRRRRLRPRRRRRRQRLCRVHRRRRDREVRPHPRLHGRRGPRRAGALARRHPPRHQGRARLQQPP